ncbi:MAG: NYN domain-containing protein [Patescibacteria group bacterium]
MNFDISHRRVGVFIDVQNMYYSARNIFQSKVNFGNIVTKTVGPQQLVRAIAYTISTKTGDELPFFEALHKMGIEVNSKELQEFDSGHKKGDWDVGITIDVVRMVDMLDVVVLVSGDGDYVPLGEYVKNRGRIFQVASFRESTSSKLVECADIYTNFSDEKGEFLIKDARYRNGLRGNGGEGGDERSELNPAEEIRTEEIRPVTVSLGETRLGETRPTGRERASDYHPTVPTIPIGKTFLRNDFIGRVGSIGKATGDNSPKKRGRPKKNQI